MWTKKPLARKENLIQTKNKASNELWMDWENHLEKDPIQKIEKNSKKSEWNCRMWTKNHYRETKFLFKHHFRTLL